MANRIKFTAAKKAAFLDIISKTANVSAAARQIGTSRGHIYRKRDRDAAFAIDWDEAIETATDALEAEARRRALDGWDEPVFYQGQQVGRKYSDRMLELLLRAHRPERFKDRREVEHLGVAGLMDKLTQARKRLEDHRQAVQPAGPQE